MVLLDRRLAAQKEAVGAAAPDIAAFTALSDRVYRANRGEPALRRKAEFLRAFAQEIPVVMFPHERLVGSMRFCHAPTDWDTFSRNEGHIIVDYGFFLQNGVDGVRQRIDGLSEGEEKRAFSHALNSFALYIRRHAEAAQALADGGSQDMAQVAACCRRLIREAPRTFREALQLVWFIHVFLHAEGGAAAVSFGRFDQYLYPFYKRDREAGLLDRGEAETLLQAFWLKTCEGDESQSVTLGGPGENELSLLCLEATRELRVKQPSIAVRLCGETSEPFLERCLAVTATGLGMPAYFNDETVEASLKSVGVSPPDAADYGIVGCYEATPAGKALGLTTTGELYLHEVLLSFLETGADYEDFETLYEDFKAYFRESYVRHSLPAMRKQWETIQREAPSPFESLCMPSCLQSGRAAENGGAAYTLFGLNILGIGTLIDSLYAVKTLVFDEREMGYRAFVDQVLANFPDRALARRCRLLAGKYGTDSPVTNAMAADLSRWIARTVAENPLEAGITVTPGLFRFTADMLATHRATPDGRLHGERLSYGVYASDGSRGVTPTAALRSAAHIAHDRFPGGNPLLLFLDKRTAGDAPVVSSLIKGYFQQGGFHVAFNAVDADELKDAVRHPEQHADLMIRISGYSTPFVGLDPHMQRALIERAMQGVR